MIESALTYILQHVQSANANNQPRSSDQHGHRLDKRDNATWVLALIKQHARGLGKHLEFNSLHAGAKQLKWKLKHYRQTDQQ